MKRLYKIKIENKAGNPAGIIIVGADSKNKAICKVANLYPEMAVPSIKWKRGAIAKRDLEIPANPNPPLLQADLIPEERNPNLDLATLQNYPF